MRFLVVAQGAAMTNVCFSYRINTCTSEWLSWAKFFQTARSRKWVNYIDFGVLSDTTNEVQELFIIHTELTDNETHQAPSYHAFSTGQKEELSIE